MRIVAWGLGLLCLCLAGAHNAQATVNIHVDLSTQRMTVTSAEGEEFQWPVSTARKGYVTPRGVFRPQAMLPVAFSKKYNNSPMPHSIFFTGSYAIHGSYEVGHLGRPASHGCVRLAPANAATLFAMVKKEGAVITITGSPPGSGVLVASSGKHHAKPIVVAKHHHHGGQVTALGYAPQPQAKPLKLWLENPVAP